MRQRKGRANLEDLRNVNEDVLEIFRRDKVASVTAASGGRFKNRLLKLKERFPEDVEIIAQNEDGSLFAHIPAKWVKIAPPPKQREMTEAERAELVERGKELARIAAEKRAQKKSEAQAAEVGEYMNAPE